MTQEHEKYIEKLLNLYGNELWTAWDNQPDDMLEQVEISHENRNTDTIWKYIYKDQDGNYYEYSYVEDYFGDWFRHNFRKVKKVLVVQYEWK